MEPYTAVLALMRVEDITIFQSLRYVKIPAAAMDANKRITFFEPLSLTCNVSAAACPMAYGNSFVSMKYFRKRAVKISPRATPPSVTASSWGRLTCAPGSSIQMPGMVNAIPPATIAPADMAVCVTLIS